MTLTRRHALTLAAAAGLVAACGRREASRADAPGGSPEIRALIDAAARRHGVPADLVHRVVRAESTYNPRARTGPYMGLMQIHPATARTMGFRGEAADLLDPATNLEYGVRYLRGAWIVARGDRDRAVMWYRRGYYYEAKRLGLLAETGLRG